MYLSNMLPDDYTLATLSKVFGELEDLISGKLIHGKSVRIGFISDIVVANSVMSMYCKCGELGEARKLFNEMPHKSVGSWNVVIAGYAARKDCIPNLDLWKLFRKMQADGFKPDAFTIATLLPVYYSNDGELDYGRELHCYLVKNGLDL
ncbi:hypothetical protein L6164_013013 [Bauhinia variegata]|uniref:Uncharacterized protein n=1 Tax=Bauhinia variegata TaxID=167791 RepID=A0ACB9PBU3_BAUVA|nr:hypothetical protein L6164_013013 [Bauhinia variegata]